jgi:nitrate reductase NapAB chaperone NapD
VKNLIDMEVYLCTIKEQEVVLQSKKGNIRIVIRGNRLKELIDPNLVRND